MFPPCRHIFEDKKYAEEYRADDLEASARQHGALGCCSLQILEGP